MCIEFAIRRLDPLVTGHRFENWFTIPCTDFPALNVGHQFGLFVAVATALLQKFTIPFGHQHWVDGKFGRTRFDLFVADVLVVQKIQIHRNGGDAKVAGNQLPTLEVDFGRIASEQNALVSARWRKVLCFGCRRHGCAVDVSLMCC